MTINTIDINYKKSIQINASAKQLFEALNEGLQSWWGKTSNTSFKTEGQFTIHFENGYWWAFKILEHTPDKELVWKCIDGEPEFNKEWIGHVLHWHIKEDGTKTILDFHQIGLTTNLHCYETCSSTWNRFITKELINYLEKKP